MDNKKWFKMSTISSFWIFLTSLIYTLIGSVLLFFTGEEKEMLKKFIMNELNTDFIMIMSTGSMFASAIISSFILSLSKQSDKLDKLDEETQKYYEARKRLEQKINNL